MNQITGFFEEFRFLSNFHEHPEAPVFIDGLDGTQISCCTVENAFQALKSDEPQARRLIAEAPTPGQSKKMGKRVTLRKDWEIVKIGAMTELLVQKFTQSPLKEMLLATGDAELIEGNTWGDKFWCVCDGEGQNNLGILLMKIREGLKKGAA